MHRRTRMLLGLILAFLITSSGVSTALACPNCKEAVSSSESEAVGASMGYNWSVVFMLCVPFSMLGTGMFFVRRAVRRGCLPEM
jgi:hypothetical protein